MDTLEVAPAPAPLSARETTDVLIWETDPGAPPRWNTPVLQPMPDLAGSLLPVAVAGRAPSSHSGRPGTADFLYWNLADSLRRTAGFWGPLMPPPAAWNPAVRGTLIATLDAGDELNAFYDRRGVWFEHHLVSGIRVMSGESPDVVCHEVGHAVLDALKPGLWDVMGVEPAAFHESFGDISSILSNLMLPSLRAAVIVETNGNLAASSQLSRLAEQLGWAIRQESPNSVEPDCLRNASNNFAYQDPRTLPNSAPASMLARSPHSFSRVFTGAFLRMLAGIFQDQGSRDADALLTAARDAGRLMVEAVRAARAVPGFFAEVAAHVIACDQDLNGGRYNASLRRAFLAHGILSPRAATELPRAAAGIAPDLDELTTHRQDGRELGLDRPLTFQLPAGSTQDGLIFVADLISRGRVITPADRQRRGLIGTATSPGRQTHEMVEQDDELVLVRRLFL
ncbi:hypothetical protein [Actinoplanes sp. NPDC020271]|uniref:hypothetical protein n=1 Tax=Actinoplanes sp. NPDC020271 TaxID=3363896 RepID=UPI0037A87664